MLSAVGIIYRDDGHAVEDDKSWTKEKEVVLDSRDIRHRASNEKYQTGMLVHQRWLNWNVPNNG